MKTRMCCLVGVVGALCALAPRYGAGADREGLARLAGVDAVRLVTDPNGRLPSAVAGAPPTLRFLLTPVPSQGSGSYPPGSNITGQTLNAPTGGFRAFFNVQIEDWDPSGNGPVLGLWQTKVDGNGWLGANAVPPQAGCNIVPTVLTCPSANAAGHAACAAEFGETGTLCENVPPLRCEWGFANRTRADWVHLAEEPDVVEGANLFSSSPIFFGVCTAGGVGSVDGGLRYYGGTLAMDIPACASGQYTVSFKADETFGGDEASPTNIIPTLELVSAVVNIAPLPPECETDDDCDDLDPCTTDTCNGGFCDHAPIPNCPPPSSGLAFTYQGYLEKPAGMPVNNTCDFRFGLFDAATAGNPQGASPQTVPGVSVVNGSFAVVIDFGAGVFNGDPRWLEIEVQCPSDAGFAMLLPRVELTPVPYAIRALEGVGPPDTIEIDPATGYVGIGTTTPSQPLEMASGAHVTAGGVWTDASDRNVKENFMPLDRGVVLELLAELEVARWNYKAENPSVQHIGPVAQDFNALFRIGADDKHLAALDTAGVALAAIQGLHELVQEKDCEIDELRSEIEDLKELVKALAAQQSGGGR